MVLAISFVIEFNKVIVHKILAMILYRYINQI